MNTTPLRTCNHCWVNHGVTTDPAMVAGSIILTMSGFRVGNRNGAPSPENPKANQADPMANRNNFDEKMCASRDLPCRYCDKRQCANVQKRPPKWQINKRNSSHGAELVCWHAMATCDEHNLPAELPNLQRRRGLATTEAPKPKRRHGPYMN